jgi:hypothetical protein
MSPSAGVVPTRYEGLFRHTVNTVPNAGIHDDDAARRLGFAAAFVPGTVVSSVALIPVLAHFGRGWLGNGWFDATFVSPVYEHERVREEATQDGNDLQLRVVGEDGRLCLAGRAGSGRTPPWDPRADGCAAADVLPRVTVGEERPPVTVRMTRDEVLPMLDSAGDGSPWYRADTAFGAPVVPPIRLMRRALDAARGHPLATDGVRQPGMWAAHALVLHAPLQYDHAYTMVTRIADKGRSGRTLYVTQEFTLHDGAQLVAIGRHRSKWLEQRQTAA